MFSHPTETRFQENLLRNLGWDDKLKVSIIRNIELDKYILQSRGMRIQRRNTFSNRATTPVRSILRNNSQTPPIGARGRRRNTIHIPNPNEILARIKDPPLTNVAYSTTTSTASVLSPDLPVAQLPIPRATSTPILIGTTSRMILARVNSPVPDEINSMDLASTISTAIARAGHNDGITDLLSDDDNDTSRHTMELNFSDQKFGSLNFLSDD